MVELMGVPKFKQFLSGGHLGAFLFVLFGEPIKLEECLYK